HFERDADRAPSEERVLLARHPQVRWILVGADVERANRDRAVADRRENLLVELHLLIFVGKILVGQERKFGTKQTDAFGAILERHRDVVLERDVREHLHPMAIAGGSYVIVIRPQLAPEGIVALD